jgi:alpha-ketoglutarate-dependent taurine dioxygenase
MFTSKFSGLHIEHGKTLLDSELLEYARGLSSVQGNLEDQILHWDFGAIMNMKFDPEASNYLFSKEAVPLHWDGAFYREPRKLLFYCTQSAGEGGETVFLNTELLWESLTEVEKEELRKITLTYSTEKKAHYGGVINIPVVQDHPMTKKTILRMAEKVETTLNPVTMVISGIDDPANFYERMIVKLNNPDFQYVHRWTTGDLIVCDNFTYLHGRRTLKNNMNRSFKRIQIL